MERFSEEQRLRIGRAVEAERLNKQWGKEEAARHAKISSITWKKIEDGETVQPTKMRAVEIALGWGVGSIDRIARGREIAVKGDAPFHRLGDAPWAGTRGDKALWDGLAAATQFARDCEARGANPTLVGDFIGDAIALISEVGRIVDNPSMSSLLDDLTEADAPEALGLDGEPDLRPSPVPGTEAPGR